MQEFTHVTKALSVQSKPTLCLVLPLYEFMKMKLSDLAKMPTRGNAETVPPQMKKAAEAALEKLEEYYRLARASKYIRVATGVSTLFWP